MVGIKIAMTDKDYDKLKKIEEAIQAFDSKNLYKSSLGFFKALDYQSEKTSRINPTTFDGFLEEFSIPKDSLSKEKALSDQWKSIEFIFQFGEDELKKELTSQSMIDFGNNGYKVNQFKSFLFFSIGLSNESYKRSDFVKITREVNIPFTMPVIVLFHYGHKLTLSIIDRRLNKKDISKDVLKKVTLIKDIDIKNPQRAHKEILKDLSLAELNKKHELSSFEKLHEAWRATLNISELNKRFYREIFNWYLWASKLVKFPQIRPEEDLIPDEIHQSESLIRLLTRLMFCWFMKERGLISDHLFEERSIKRILLSTKPEETTYYLAILQNLFFATLNQPIEKRKPLESGWNKEEYGDPLIYRHSELFQQPEKMLSFFEEVPFLNGGLFDCLDQKKDLKHPFEIRLDGFSSRKNKQPIVPNLFFFSEFLDVDLGAEYGEKKNLKVKVRGLIEILSSYKFTIEENTPVEEEIALDPELLGKVFENLLASYNPETKTTARKQTGSFYTPREIVDYMVDQSLISYLKAYLPDIESKEIELSRLFDFKYAESDTGFNSAEKKNLLEAIHKCRILDPACGSGAFPMGVLQKMIYVIKRLDPQNILWLEMVVQKFPEYLQNKMRQKLKNESWDYVRKIGIISDCIYGIDIQPIAIQISKLRFFISLLVDQREKPGMPNRGFDPLPNLDFKLIAANSLISAPKSETTGIGLFVDQIDAFQENLKSLTSRYFSTYLPEEKKNLREKIELLVENEVQEKVRRIEKVYRADDQRIEKALRETSRVTISRKERDVELWKSYARLFKHEAVEFFEIPYFFPNVSDGFDIIIGNPPYVSIQRLENTSELKNAKYETFENTGDLYSLFYEQGMNLLKDNGILCYITSNKWINANYGKSTRKYFATKTNPLILIDFAKVKIFESATVFVNILITEKSNNKNQLLACAIQGDQLPKIDLREYFDLNKFELNDLNDSIWKVSNSAANKINSIIEIVATPLNEWTDVQIFRGITSGLNEAFHIDEKGRSILLNKNPKNDEIIKPLLRGKDIKRWSYNFANCYILNTHNGLRNFLEPVNVVKDYPDVYNHLKGFLPFVQERQDQGFHWTNLRDCAFLLEFEKPKIVWIEISDRANYAYDETGKFLTNSAYFMTGKHLKYILAVLNSKVADYYFFQITATIAGGRKRYTGQYVDQVPIPQIPEKDEEPFNKMVDYILILKENDHDQEARQACNYFESVLEAMVYELYFTNAVKEAGYEVIRHVSKLHFVEKDANALNKLLEIYHETSEKNHPIRNSSFYITSVPVVKEIEETFQKVSRKG